jgi:hypothetical protein
MKLTILGVLILAAGFLRLPPAEGAVTNSVTNSCTADTSGATFANAVKVLQRNYVPSQFGIPPVDATTTPSSYMLADLQNAFQIAPPRFQQMLCGLDGVYLDPTNGSWGFRNPISSKEYVGLSISVLWPNPSASAIDFRTYETARIRKIFNLSGYGPYYGYAVPDNTSQMTILAALAHEVGHIFWYDANKTAGGSYTYGFCSKHFLDSWNKVTTPDYWIALGYIDYNKNEHQGNPSNDNIKVQDIQQAIGKESAVLSIVQALYSKNGRWASSLAAFTPTEDLVETFEYIVLQKSKSGLTSFPLWFQPSNGGALQKIGDIPGDDRFNSKPNFNPKKQCFSGF